jgi:hypothetical protein
MSLAYIVRNDARRFFRRGRVETSPAPRDISTNHYTQLFSILFSEACGDTANMQDNENITVVKLGGKVYTQIRRFGKTVEYVQYSPPLTKMLVVVSESNGHCNAW